MVGNKLSLVCCISMLFAGNAIAGNDKQANEFYSAVMNAGPLLPENLSAMNMSCEVSTNPSGLASEYLTSTQVNYQQQSWQQRISKDWQFFSSDAGLGKIAVIDFAKNREGQLAYRYLSNGTQNELYEPWSSSKIFAYSGAMSIARKQKVGGLSTIGKYPVADLITSINSYEPFGTADGDSNAIATYFANVAGRDFLTSLFHDAWLKMDNPDIKFRGAYAVKVFDPQTTLWTDKSNGTKANIDWLKVSSEDPGYLGYRCDECGLTGNKPMTTLAQAEWLKRLAVHDRDSVTRHPGLHSNDIQVLLYGTGHSDPQAKVGGMMQGIGRMLSHAIARQISGNTDVTHQQAKQILDKATDGNWRIFQKIGWGPSETRGAGENVLLAHVCLPKYQGGREFTIAAQAQSKGNGEVFVGYSGLKMQQLLDASMIELLADNAKQVKD